MDPEMSNIILMDGKSLSESLISKYIYIENTNKPKLVVITVGEDPASKIYINNKIKACKKCNIDIIHKEYNLSISRNTLIRIIKNYNSDDSITGILIQQPLPKALQGIEQYVEPKKDVDGFTYENIGKSLYGNTDKDLIACTPKGIITLLDFYKVPLESKKVCILGRSNIVGKPLIGLLLARNCTVISCNSYTQDLYNHTLNADIIISAMGKPKFIGPEYIGRNCICLIDVGINRDESGNLCGDFNTESIIKAFKQYESNLKRYITPVPKGVGPMTIASLIQNINIAYNNQILGG